MPRGRTDGIGRAGEHYVAAELNRRGAHASPFSGNVPAIDVIATDGDMKHVAYIQVKTKRGRGNWQMSLNHGWSKITLSKCPGDGKCPKPCTPSLQEPIAGKPDHHWVFVSLSKDGGQQYYVLADDKVRTLLREGHQDYLKEHCGQRPSKNHNSLHCMFTDQGLQAWKDNWEILGLGPLPVT